MPTWTWVLGGTPPGGTERRELTGAVGRSLTLRVDGAATAQFTLNGRSDEAAEIATLATDLHIYRDGIKLFRGRIGPETDTIDDTQHASQFTATDYRGMLNTRIVGASGAAFSNVEQTAIAWNLIAASQALPGGNWGITNGLGAGAIGQTRDRTYDPGKPLGDAITELGRVDNGFEWEIDPTLVLRRWFPVRGVAAGLILDYGGVVTRVARTMTPTDFANAVLVTGTQGLTPATAVTATVATDPRGRWERSVGYASVQEATTLAARAAWLLTQTQVLRPELVATLTPGRWDGLSAMGLGDIVTLSVVSGRLAINALYRVVEINLTPGDDGTETITAGLIPQ